MCADGRWSLTSPDSVRQTLQWELLTMPHHSASAYVSNISLSSFSTEYTRKEARMRHRKPMYQAVINSCRDGGEQERENPCYCIQKRHHFNHCLVRISDLQSVHLLVQVAALFVLSLNKISIISNTVI